MKGELSRSRTVKVLGTEPTSIGLAESGYGEYVALRENETGVGPSSVGKAHPAPPVPPDRRLPTDVPRGEGGSVP